MAPKKGILEKKSKPIAKASKHEISMKIAKAEKPVKVKNLKKGKQKQKLLVPAPPQPKKIENEQKKSDKPVETKKKHKRYAMPAKAVTEEIVGQSLDALQRLADNYKKSNRMFEEETPIFAEIRCIKIQNSKGNIKFVLPNSTVASTGEVCLITPDLKKGKKVDHEPTVDHWEELLRKAGVTCVKTIMPMRQLRVEYDQYELKRRLLTQHDFIMVDTRVLTHVSHVLGKIFFKKHNMLVPVRIDEKKDLKKAIESGLKTAMLRLNIGETSTIQVGHLGMDRNLIKENVLSLVKQLKDRYPGGEANVRYIGLKLALSLSLPIYMTLRPSNTVSTPKLVHKLPKNYKVVEDELTTFPGRKVAVAPDGTVTYTDNAEDDSEMEDLEEEGEQSEEEKAASEAEEQSD